MPVKMGQTKMAKVYQFVAINKTGKEIKGTVSAESDKLARRKLKEDNLIPIEVNAISKRNVDQEGGVSKKSDKAISLQDLSIFTRELSALLNAGLEVEQSIYSLSNQI